MAQLRRREEEKRTTLRKTHSDANTGLEDAKTRMLLGGEAVDANFKLAAKNDTREKMTTKTTTFTKTSRNNATVFRTSSPVGSRDEAGPVAKHEDAGSPAVLQSTPLIGHH